LRREKFYVFDYLADLRLFELRGLRRRERQTEEEEDDNGVQSSALA
jgi:hypothetical protein